MNLWTEQQHILFRQATTWALELHQRQLRKCSGTPYVSHLLAVAAMVMEQGADAETAIAALLHDAVEDQGGEPTAIEIENRFGPRVRKLVEACTDAWGEPKQEWRMRKERFVASVATAGPDACLIIVADKVHNLRCLIRDFEQLGDSLWSAFKTGKSSTLWYYQAVYTAVKDSQPQIRLLSEYERTLSELKKQCE